MAIGIVFSVIIVSIALAGESDAYSTHSTGVKAGLTLVILFTVGILIAGIVLSVSTRVSSIDDPFA